MTTCGIVLGCMDGRAQGLEEKLKKDWHVDKVDTITRAGAVGIIIKENSGTGTSSDKFGYEDICRHIEISINDHDSTHLAVVGHADCAGHPVLDDDQKNYINSAVEILSKKYHLKVNGIWIGRENLMPERATFGTVVTFMDGGFLEPLQDKLTKEWDVAVVDTITRAGAVGIIIRANTDTTDNPDIIAYEDICWHIEISLKKHESKHLAIAGHRVSDAAQKDIIRAAKILSIRFCLPVEGYRFGEDFTPIKIYPSTEVNG